MKSTLSIIKNLGYLIFLVSISASTSASVTLTGTRIIYPENAKFVNLQFQSPDKTPNIMEVWASEKDISTSAAKDASAPFVTTPHVFRIDPNKGQIVKLSYTGSNIAQDRESVFYLNFLQIPAMKKENQDKNKLLVTYRSTVKIFYRPKNLKGDPQKVASQLKIDASKLSSGSLTLINPTEYHVSINSIDFSQNGKNVHSVKDHQLRMIAPFSKQNVAVKAANINAAKTTATIKIINDTGGISTAEIEL